MATQAEPPLSALLSQVLIAFTREYERGGAELLSLPMWADFLRVITPDGVEAREIPKLARISRRAVPPLLSGVARDAQFVESDNPSGKRGAGVARLTKAGGAASDAARTAIREAEKRWTDEFGTGRLSATRTALEGVVSQLDLELPHYPVGYGAVDWRITGGAHAPARPGPPRIPAHGADWAPVLRDRDADSLSGLPFFALVSQALVAFAIDYEARAGALWSAANVLRQIDDTGAPLAATPPAAGITGAGKSGLERHGIVTVTSDRNNPATKRVHLTPIGKQLRDAYVPLTAHVEREWKDQYGSTAVGALRNALAALSRDLDPSLPHYPTITWVGGLRESSR